MFGCSADLQGFHGFAMEREGIGSRALALTLYSGFRRPEARGSEGDLPRVNWLNSVFARVGGVVGHFRLGLGASK